MINPLLLIASEAAAEKEGIAVLGIDPKAIVLQAGTFLLLFFILKKFALKSIVDTLENRRKTIDKGVNLGIEMEAAKNKFDDQLKGMQREARAKADDILAEAQKEASKIIKEGEEAAAKKIDDMFTDANARIERELHAAQSKLRGEMLELVSEATEVIIGEKLDSKKDASLIERALAKVGAKA